MVYMMQVSIFWKFYTFLTESGWRNIAKTYNKSLTVFIDHEFWVTQKISRISPHVLNILVSDLLVES